MTLPLATSGQEFHPPLPNRTPAMGTTEIASGAGAASISRRRQFVRDTVGPWTAGAVAAALLAGCSPRAAPPAAPSTQTAGGLTVQMTTTPAPPHTGDDTLNLILTDSANGTPVGDANVTATTDMLSPREPGQSNSGRAQGNGLYQVPMRLPIATKYEVQVQIERRGGQPPVSVMFPLEATQ